MRRILVHCPMPFYGTSNVSKILKQNLVNLNSGNLLYYTGVARTIMTSDCVITNINIGGKLSDDKIDEINNVYDMCIIPLANAFRPEYMSVLQNMTDNINKLKIPCAVVCVGAQKKSEKSWDEAKTDNEKVQKFIRAVLSKSATIGVRGYETGDYLKLLGFEEDRDFTVVGCPSMYLYGDNLPVPKHTNLTHDSKVSITLKPVVQRELYDFIRKQEKQFSDYTYISQVTNELKTLYVSWPFSVSEKTRPELPENWPTHVTDEEMASGKMVGVVCPETWIEYLKTRDFLFGTRIHGNIAGVLAGIPTYIITDDTRVKELAEYHNIPHSLITDITDETNIFKLYEHADYSKLHDGHADRVTKWLNFLDKNGIQHITREELNSTNAPYDIEQEKIMKAPVFKAFSAVDVNEQERRIKEYVSAPK